MSEKNPNFKREFEEASRKIVSPLKKTKLSDDSSDSHNVVLTASSSASDECSVTSTEEEEEENDYSSSIVSGCVSTESKEISKNSSTSVVDLEAHQISETETIIRSNFRKETSPVSVVLGETATEVESSSATETKDNRTKSSEVISKTPTRTEIEDFFSELENGDKQKQFIEKYNFDIVNDEPLQGRYEWDRVKP